MDTATIPNRLIFVWVGERLPLVAQLAIASAIRVLRPEEAVLLGQGLPLEEPGVRALSSLPAFRLVPIDASLFDGLPGFARGNGWTLYGELEQAAARSNLVRLVELWHRGGIYLDTDTITLRPLDELLNEPGFIGLEPVAYPASVMRSLRPLPLVRGLGGAILRRACLLAPAPERAFERIRRLFTDAVNNAVIGARPHNPLIGRALESAAAMGPRQRLRRFRLGTHLLQEVTGNRSSPDMRVLEPPWFYPLGPEISVEWFAANSADRLLGGLDDRTRIIHWYASVQARLVRPIDRNFIVSEREQVAFARIAYPYLDDVAR